MKKEHIEAKRENYVNWKILDISLFDFLEYFSYEIYSTIKEDSAWKFLKWLLNFLFRQSYLYAAGNKKKISVPLVEYFNVAL